MRAMKKLLALVLVASACAAPQPKPQAQPQVKPAAAAPAAITPPVAKRVPHQQTLHGRTLEDDYFWLRQKGTPDVENYLKAENAYTEAMTKATQPFQEALYQEMLGRIQQTDASVPHRKNGWYYYSRTVEGQQYPIYCRKSAKGAAKDDLTGDTAKSPEEVMIDLNELGKTQKFVGLGAIEISDDARWLAYSIDSTGFRQYTLRFKDLSTGKISPESIERVDAVAWAADNKTVFYVVEDDTAKRPYRLYRHVVGEDAAKDALVFEEKDEMFVLTVGRMRSGAYLISGSHSSTTTENRVLDAKKPLGAWQVIEPRVHDHKYYVDHGGNQFYIVTNSPAQPGGNKSVNFRLVTAPVATPGRAHWKELIAHRDDVKLDDAEVFADHLMLSERADALPRLRVLPLKKGAVAEDIKMPEALYAVFPDANEEFDASAYRFHFQSPITPDTVYDYDIKTKQLTQRKRVVVKNVDPSQFETARTQAVATDGTRIPISLVYKKGMKPDPAQPHPMLLYGYGSYGFSIPLTFSSDRYSLLERGVVFALAHIRGGGDMGKPWHEAGRMRTKMNTFTDFVACGETLEKMGWTAKDRVVIQGGSAGGLLMGAVTNLRPDLWKGVVAQVPFVDVINTMLDETLPLTVGEFEEWGNPKKKDEFEWIARYSPYDNVAKKEYPAILVESSYNDSQVMYWEPAKYVAKLRALKTDTHALLFKVNMEPAGHGGQSGRYDRLHETAFTFAWLLGQLGINK
jgi:oligopeptidase B